MVLQAIPSPFPSFYPDPDYPMDSYWILKRQGVTAMVTISNKRHSVAKLQNDAYSKYS